MNKAFTDMLHSAVAQEARKEAESRGQLTLGMLKEKLSKYDDELLVELDVGGSPCETHSYRGYYDQLAFERGDLERTVADVMQMLEDATGATYTGYKGGDYTMTDYTMVWGSNYGTASGIALVGVEKQEGKVIIQTRDIYKE